MDEIDDDTKSLAEVLLIEAQAELAHLSARSAAQDKELRYLRSYLRGLNVNPSFEFLKEIYDT